MISVSKYEVKGYQFGGGRRWACPRSVYSTMTRLFIELLRSPVTNKAILSNNINARPYQQVIVKIRKWLMWKVKCFVDLEKAFDRVPREVIRWAMHKLGVEEWLITADMSMYTGAKTVVRTVYGNSECFEVKVGMHQGSALSPLLFCDCHGSHIPRIQGCLTMGAVVC